MLRWREAFSKVVAEGAGTGGNGAASRMDDSSTELEEFSTPPKGSSSVSSQDSRPQRVLLEEQGASKTPKQLMASPSAISPLKLGMGLSRMGAGGGHMFFDMHMSAKPPQPSASASARRPSFCMAPTPGASRRQSVSPPSPAPPSGAALSIATKKDDPAAPVATALTTPAIQRTMLCTSVTPQGDWLPKERDRGAEVAMTPGMKGAVEDERAAHASLKDVQLSTLLEDAQQIAVRRIGSSLPAYCRGSGLAKLTGGSEKEGDCWCDDWLVLTEGVLWSGAKRSRLQNRPSASLGPSCFKRIAFLQECSLSFTWADEHNCIAIQLSADDEKCRAGDGMLSRVLLVLPTVDSMLQWAGALQQAIWLAAGAYQPGDPRLRDGTTPRGSQDIDVCEPSKWLERYSQMRQRRMV